LWFREGEWEGVGYTGEAVTTAPKLPGAAALRKVLCLTTRAEEAEKARARTKARRAKARRAEAEEAERAEEAREMAEEVAAACRSRA